jgi:hypothetical protein
MTPEVAIAAQPTPTGIEEVLLPTLTPTRIPFATITATPVGAGITGVFIPSGVLVDGPLPPTPLPIPPELVSSSAPAVEAQPTSGPTIVIQLDATLQGLGVWVEPAVVPIGADYWRLTSARWLSSAESQGRNVIMLEVVDKNGQRVVGQPLTVSWKDGSVSAKTNKPNPEVYAFDFPMNASGNAYSIRIDDLPSETIHGLGMGTIEDPLAATQTSFYLTFQQVTRQ